MSRNAVADAAIWVRGPKKSRSVVPGSWIDQYRVNFGVSPIFTSRASFRMAGLEVGSDA